MTYLDRFVDALRFFFELEPSSINNKPDEKVLRQHLQEVIAELEPLHGKIADVVTVFASNFFANMPTRLRVEHNCHGISHNFYMSWSRLPFAEQVPLAMTIGNVFYHGENIYGATKESVQKILKEGFDGGKTLDVHVWLTLPDLRVIDLTILQTLTNMGKLDIGKARQTPYILWEGSKPSAFKYEPILVDNEFAIKVDRFNVV